MVEFALGFATAGFVMLAIRAYRAPSIQDIERAFQASHRDTPLEERARKAGYR